MELVFLNKDILWLIVPVLFLSAIYTYILKKVPLFLSVIGVLIILTLSDPMIKKGYRSIVKTDTQIAITIDTSLSMAVNDIKPNRFFAAKKKLEKLIKKIKDVKIGVVEFSDRARIILYPTDDKKIVLKEIENFNPILKGGTDLKEAISISNSILQGQDNIIILVTDGGDESIENLISLSKSIRSRILFYGIGTKKGGFVPEYNVLSKININLSKLSQLTGGMSVFYKKTDDDIKKIAHFIENISKKNRKEILKIPDYVDLSPFIAVFTLVLIFFRYLMLKLLFIFLLIIFPNISYAGEFLGYIMFFTGKYDKAAEEFLEDKKPENLYNAGVSFLKAGYYDKALNIFKQIKSEDIDLQRKIKYNMAYIYTKKKNYEKAYSILKDLYQIYPEDKQIKKLFLFVEMVENLKQSSKIKKTVVEIKEIKKRKNPRSQGETGSLNPW